MVLWPNIKVGGKGVSPGERPSNEYQTGGSTWSNGEQQLREILITY